MYGGDNSIGVGVVSASTKGESQLPFGQPTIRLGFENPMCAGIYADQRARESRRILTHDWQGRSGMCRLEQRLLL